MPFDKNGAYIFTYEADRTIRYSIRPYMVEALYDYLRSGKYPGEFLYMILISDFVHAAAGADADNIINLQAYMAFLYNEMPINSWGSKENVDKWMKMKHPECLSYSKWLHLKLKEQNSQKEALSE